MTTTVAGANFSPSVLSSDLMSDGVMFLSRFWPIAGYTWLVKWRRTRSAVDVRWLAMVRQVSAYL